MWNEASYLTRFRALEGNYQQFLTFGADRQLLVSFPASCRINFQTLLETRLQKLKEIAPKWPTLAGSPGREPLQPVKAGFAKDHQLLAVLRPCRTPSLKAGFTSYGPRTVISLPSASNGNGPSSQPLCT